MNDRIDDDDDNSDNGTSYVCVYMYKKRKAVVCVFVCCFVCVVFVVNILFFEYN